MADLQYWRKHHGKLGKAGCAVVILLHNTLRVIVRALQCAFLPIPQRNRRLQTATQRSLYSMGSPYLKTML